jgi:uncharacterized membrane protein
MNFDCSIEIAAPAPLVWEVFADVERWPEWTASVRRLTALGDAPLAIGNRYRIEQPRFPKLVWEVVALDPGASWSWEQRSPGNRSVATHEVVPLDGERTLVRQRIEQTGPAAALVSRAFAGITRRYLDLEAQGLKRRSEERRQAGAASA